jgi:hypothetical protein
MALRWGFLALLVALYFIGSSLTAHQAPIGVLALLMGLVFVTLVVAMYLRLLPALLALPILAIALAAIAGMAWPDILSVVVQDGSARLAKWIIAAIFGAILAQVVEKTGIAQTAIKKTAELGGDNPLLLGALLTLVIALLFTTLGGLGAVIMVATIVIPILLSLGLRPLFVSCLFLLAMSLGGSFNLVNWQFYQSELGLTTAQITAFAWPFAGFMLLTTLAFLVIESKRMGKARFRAVVTEDSAQVPATFVPWYALLTPIVPLVPVLIFALLPRFTTKAPEVSAALIGQFPPHSILARQTTIHVIRLAADGTPANVPKVTLRSGEQHTLAPGHYRASIQPTMPIPIPALAQRLETSFTATPWTRTTLEAAYQPTTGDLQLTAIPTPTNYDFPITVALLIGILYGALTTWRRGQSTVQLLTKASFDGVSAVGPALVLMVGIGMVLNATMSPQVSTVISPLLKTIVPQNTTAGAAIGYVILFTLLAPLALYRGPLNLYGMGAGLIGALSGLMPAGAIMGAFMSVGMIQGVCDPTNTHNVWLANYTNTDVQELLKRTLPYMWLLALVGLALSAGLYFK